MSGLDMEKIREKPSTESTTEEALKGIEPFIDEVEMIYEIGIGNAVWTPERVRKSPLYQLYVLTKLKEKQLCQSDLQYVDEVIDMAIYALGLDTYISKDPVDKSIMERIRDGEVNEDQYDR